MSALDRIAEREVADFAESVRPAPEARGPLWPRAKRFGEAFLTGFAFGRVLRRFFS